MIDPVNIRIIAEVSWTDRTEMYTLGSGELDLTGLTSPEQAMRQVPIILRGLADQFDSGLNDGVFDD